MALNLFPLAHANRATLLQLELPESTESIPLYAYYTDYFRDVNLKGITYKTGVIKSIRNIKFTRELTAHKVKVQFTGLDEQQLNIILADNSSFLNKSIVITQVFLDPVTEEELADPIVLFEGMITGASLVDKRSGNNNSSVIEWDCANHFQDFQQVVGRITDDFTHRGMVVENGVWQPSIATKRPEYAYDKGFYHANQSINVLAKYQTEEKKFKLVKKKNWHGLSSDVRLREYTEVVTKEVDIRFDLSAKFLPIVYGVQKVPTIPIFADTDKNDPSSVWVVYAVCEGEIEGFYDIYFDDTPIICLSTKDSEGRICFGSKNDIGSTINNSIMPNNFGRQAPTEHGEHYVYDDGQGEINIWTYHGLPNQVASPVMVQKALNNEFFFQQDSGLGAGYWDDSFKLLDTAYIVINYKLSDLNGGRTAIPSVDVEVCGLKTKQVSSGLIVQTNNTTTNPAWQLLDYLTSYRYGMSIPLSNIDLVSFEDVAGKFDLIDDSYEIGWVNFWRYLGWDSISGDKRKIMQTNVTLASEDTIFKNVSSLLTQTNSSLNKFGGKYLYQVESDNPSTLSINLDTETIGDITVKDLTGTSKYNTVTANIVDPAKAWQANAITFYDSIYKTEDRGVEKKLNLSFPFITNYYTARSMVGRELKKSRFSRSVTFVLPFTYLGSLLPNDNVTVSYERYSWTNKEFIVDEIEILTDGKINVTLQELPLSALINAGQAEVGTGTEAIIDVSVLPVRDLTYTPSSALVAPKPNLNGELSWLPSLTSDISHYSVYWDGAPQVVLIPKPTIGSPTTRIVMDVDNLPIGSYTFTVKAVSTKGSFSAPASIQVVVGASKYLPKVTNFKVINLEPGYTDRFINNFVQLAWDRIETSTTGIKYRLQILDTNDTILREFTLPDPTNAYLYTLALNKQDYTALYGVIGAFRALRFRIRAEGDNNTVSYDWERIL